MKRILIIGNSHTGALKEGWTACGADFSGVEVSFFVAPQPTFAACGLDENGMFGLLGEATDRQRAIIQKLNGTDRINLLNFDVIVWGGYGLSFHTLASLLATYDIDGVRESEALRRMSAATYRAVCADLASDTMPTSQWRKLTGPQLVIVARPIQAETTLEDTKKSNIWKRAVRKNLSIGPALAVYIDAVEQELADRGFGFVPPPSESIGPLGLTRADYTLGSFRLASGRAHGVDDFAHMNGDYGALVVRDLMARIGVPAQTA